MTAVYPIGRRFESIIRLSQQSDPFLLTPSKAGVNRVSAESSPEMARMAAVANSQRNYACRIRMTFKFTF